MVFEISKFHHYIYGRHFELLSDHQLLKGLLDEGQAFQRRLRHEFNGGRYYRRDISIPFATKQRRGTTMPTH